MDRKQVGQTVVALFQGQKDMHVDHASVWYHVMKAQIVLQNLVTYFSGISTN